MRFAGKIRLANAFLVIFLSFAQLSRVEAKDYRVSDEKGFFSARLKISTPVKEKPFLSSKTFGELKQEDWVSIVAQYKDYYAIQFKLNSSKKYWIKKNSVQVVKEKQSLSDQVNTTSTAQSQERGQVTNSKEETQGNLKPKNSKNSSFAIGLSHYNSISLFSSHQNGVFAEYKREISPSYALVLAADFLLNETFKSYSIRAGIDYKHIKRNKFFCSSGLSAGYENLYDESRTINALIAHLEMLKIRYEYNQILSFVISPAQVRAIVSSDQNIPINFRYGLSLGVIF